MTMACEECGSPVERQEDGSLICPNCLMGYAGPTGDPDDTVIEEDVTLRQALEGSRRVREERS